MDLLGTSFAGTPLWFWLSFLAIVVTLLAFDLGVLHRDDKPIGVRASLLLSAGYIGVALLFGLWVWQARGASDGMDYLTGFLVEKSLSLDNIFVISLIFTTFAIPPAYQHRVLFWGILGVIVLRALMIGFGTVIVQRFDWVLYLFGAFLAVTGVKMLFTKEKEAHLDDNPLVRLLRRHIPVTSDMAGGRFLVRRPDAEGRMRRAATPLLLALATIELIDLVFAVDSVPAVLAISTDPFIVYTSNIFAILGLRALYFALAAIVGRFAYLKYALALVLVFIGGKIFYHKLFDAKVESWVSLAVTAGLIGGGILVSLLRTRPAGAGGSPA